MFDRVPTGTTQTPVGLTRPRTAPRPKTRDPREDEDRAKEYRSLRRARTGGMGVFPLRAPTGRGMPPH